MGAMRLERAVGHVARTQKSGSPAMGRTMRLERAVGHVALAASGVFVAHVFGYLIAYSNAGDRSAALGGHAYFGPAALAAIPLASLLLAGVVVRSARRTVGVGIRPWTVSTLTLVGFLVLEVLERVPAADHGAVLTEPGVVAGLALSLPVGWVLARLARGMEHIVDAILNASPRRNSHYPTPDDPVEALTAFAALFFGLLPSPRGPPLGCVPTI